jgi:hypothetical protein
MDGRRKPDPKPENEKELIDEEIIDLSQVVEGGDDDDIINLDNILEQPEQASDETDEVVIPLVDTIPTEETATLAEDIEDDVIDLEDVAATLEANLAEAEAEIPELPADEAAAEPDDEILDLLDVNTLDTPREEVLQPPSTVDEKEAALSEDPGDDIIDLEDVAATLKVDLPEPETEIPQLRSDEEAPVTKADEGGIDLVDLAITDEEEPAADILSAPVLPLATPISEPVPLTEQQVEDALERVIEKIYGEKIEQLMIQSIEKTVKREIEKYKKALLEDSDDKVG